MISLFESVSPVQVSILRPSLWDLASEGLKVNVKTVQDYYRIHGRPVRATHPLVRFLASLGRYYHLPLGSYVETIQPMLLRLASTEGISTSVASGAVHYGNFYDAHIAEIYIGYLGTFDEMLADTEWMQQDSLTVLCHPKSDLSLPHLDARAYSDQTGLAVIGIDLLTLAIQYRAYLHQVADGDLFVATGVQIFLSRYVLPNMLPSHIDLAILNRLFYKRYGLEYSPKVLTKHPMVLPPYEMHIDRVISTLLHNLDRVNGEYHHLLSNIPSLYHPTMHEALILPDMLQTIQVQWTLVLARLKYLHELVHLRQDNTAIGNNRVALIELKRTMTQYNVMYMLENELPLDLYMEVEAMLHDLNAIKLSDMSDI